MFALGLKWLYVTEMRNKSVVFCLFCLNYYVSFICPANATFFCKIFFSPRHDDRHVGGENYVLRPLVCPLVSFFIKSVSVSA